MIYSMILLPSFARRYSTLPWFSALKTPASLGVLGAMAALIAPLRLF
jgi:hypothetical protein